ncbi:DUF305 domain-containing protein [Streptomyces nigrescens]
MTGLAERYAGSGQAGRRAARITAVQGFEIGALEGWLRGHGGRHTMSGQHHHGETPGMATAAQLDRRRGRAAGGGRFDALCLKLMIRPPSGRGLHGDGCALGGGNNALVEEMANETIAQQSAEIGRMQRIPAKEAR